VQDHDEHYRPHAYSGVSHLELGADRIRQYKQSWERFVEDARKPNPSVLAVVTGYGTEEYVHSAKIVFQWSDGKIEFERSFHLLDAPWSILTDRIIEEVAWLGKQVKFVRVDRPEIPDHCPCCHRGLSRTLDSNMARKVTSAEWPHQSVATIYVNPDFPSILLSLFLEHECLYQAHLHRCTDALHFVDEKHEERFPIHPRPSVRAQATQVIRAILRTWEPARVLVASGDPDHPDLINDLLLPDCWERRVPGVRGPRKSQT
jgi:hypothetical protein